MDQRWQAHLALLLTLGTFSAAAVQQGGRLNTDAAKPSLVVSTSWLADHLNDRNLVLLHVGTTTDFSTAHIPGAQFVALAGISAPTGEGLSLELPGPDAARTALERLGIGNDSRVVIYFSKDQFAPAGRIFFTLDSYGLGENASILDGGLPAWQAEGRAVTAEVRVPVQSTLRLLQRVTVVDYDWVVANGRKVGVSLVDARPVEQYSGAKAVGRTPRSGHIPGAVNIPVSQLLADGVHLKRPAELASLFRGAGVGPGDRVVIYCNIGQQASADYFVARYLGYDVSLYDGSMEDWNAHGGEVVSELAAVPKSVRWVLQASGTTVRLRGVSAVSAGVAWASGSNGTFARTVDGGATWTSAAVPGAEDMDFRDVEAFGAETAYLLSVGAGPLSRIYKTVDGGRSWALQFKNLNPKAFFDGMAFWDEKSGLAIGDPVDGTFTVVRTFDGGLTWIGVPARNIPPALPGEAAFAASGTCVVTEGRANAWFGTGGGSEARVFRSTDRGFTWTVASTPVAAGLPSAGIFSLAFRDARNGVAVGGDYRNEGEASNNLASTSDGGATWTTPGTKLRGFRSAVAIVPGAGSAALVATGPAGSDWSGDGGRTWTPIEGPGFHALGLADPSGAGWAAGEDGRVAKLAGVPAQPAPRNQ